jgi:hypothetical protein
LSPSLTFHSFCFLEVYHLVDWITASVYHYPAICHTSDAFNHSDDNNDNNTLLR